MDNLIHEPACAPGDVHRPVHHVLDCGPEWFVDRRHNTEGRSGLELKVALLHSHREHSHVPAAFVGHFSEEIQI